MEKNTSHEDVDETLITPRFDREEAAEARPVVPLAVVSGEAQTFDVSGARRRSWPLALVLVSALVGSVIGGAGFYFYQQRQQAEAARVPSEALTEQVSAPSDAPLPLPLPSPEEAAALPSPSPEEVGAVEDEIVEVPSVESEKKKEKIKDSEKENADKKKDAPREKPADKAASKRGKQETRDKEPARGERRPRRVSEDPRASSDDDEEPEARRVDSIVYERERRRERRRQRRQPAVDRIRGIFEGQPER